MRLNSAFKALMAERNIRQRQLGEMLGVKTSALSERLRRKTLSIDKVIEIVDVLGAKLVIVDKDKPVEGYELDND